MRITEITFTFVLSLICYCSSVGFASAQADGNAKPAQKVVEAGPFRMHVYCDNQKVADQVQKVGEKTWQVASKLYACKLPGKKMDAHLYRNLDAYVAADEKLTGGRFKMNQAFAHHDSLTAHVALQPPISDQLLKIVGLPKQSARLIAHETAHLVRFTRMPNSFRDHPDWLADGAATYIEQQVIAALGYIDEPMNDPFFATFVAYGKNLLNQKKLPTAEQILDDVELSVSFNERHSVRWILVDMLMSKHKEKFIAFIRDLPRIGSGPGYTKRTKDLLLKILAVDTKTLDKDIREHLASMQPGWYEELRSLETAGPTWHQVAFPNSTATCWRQSPLKDSFSVSLMATIQDAGGKQMNVRIGQRTSFTQFSITAGYGLNVFEFSNNAWKTLVAKQIEGLKTGDPFALSISHDDSKSRTVLKLDGKTIFEGDVQGSDHTLALGAQNGSTVTWKNLNVE